MAAKLGKLKDRKDVVILALPRGGVPVAFEIAKALNAPLDLFVVRKLGVPNREELAFGAIASGGIKVLNESIIDTFKIPHSLIERVIRTETAELESREKLYRLNKPTVGLENKTVILVDDGIATGATIKAALTAVRLLNPKEIIVGSPVAPIDVCENICRKSDELCICLMTPEPFYGVGIWYRDFTQTRDEEVCELLEIAEKFASKQNFKRAA